jgi:hypothetical protein
MSWERSGRAVGAKALARAVENYGATVTDLLAVTGDPVRDLRAARETAQQNAAAEREYAAAALHDAGIPAMTISAWLDRRGLPAAGNGQLLDLAERCARVWSALPPLETGRLLLTVLAATALDDPHALDRGSPTATAVLRLLGHDLPDSAEAWRMAWEEHGIDCDPVSSRVLVLNLPLDGDAPCARLAQAAGSEPLWLTLRSLTGSFRMAALGSAAAHDRRIPGPASAGGHPRDRPCARRIAHGGRERAARRARAAPDRTCSIRAGGVAAHCVPAERESPRREAVTVLGIGAAQLGELRQAGPADTVPRRISPLPVPGFRKIV